jgi:hypothetical protein
VALECSGDLQATLTELCLTAQLQSVEEDKRDVRVMRDVRNKREVQRVERLAARRAELMQHFYNCASMRLLSVFPLRVFRRHLHSHMIERADPRRSVTSSTPPYRCFAQLNVKCATPKSTDSERTKTFRQFVEVRARTLVLQHDRGQLYLVLREKLQLSTAEMDEDVQRALCCDVLRALLDSSKSALRLGDGDKKEEEEEEEDDDDEEEEEEGSNHIHPSQKRCNQKNQPNNPNYDPV